MSQISPQQFVDSAIPFLLRVRDEFDGDLDIAKLHLSFASDLPGALVGSELGATIWGSPEGDQLIGLLLRDPKLAKWFTETPMGVLELRRVIVSFVAQWPSDETDAGSYASAVAQLFLDDLYGGVSASAIYVPIYGMSIPGRIELDSYRVFDPDCGKLIDYLKDRGLLEPADLIKMPKDPQAIFIATSSASREDFGPFAGASAFAILPVIMHRALFGVWLSSGVNPRPWDIFAFGVNRFAESDYSRVSFGFREFPGGDVESLSDSSINRIVPVNVRLDYLWGDRPGELDPETDTQLRLTLSTMESALRLGDEILAALFEYMVLDGLVLTMDDVESRLSRRVAWLTGRDATERRTLGKFLTAFRRLRVAVAHGKTPSRDTLSTLAGEAVGPEHFSAYFSWSGQEHGRRLARRCREQVRIAILCFLGLALAYEHGQVIPRMTRQEIIALIEEAARVDRPSRHNNWRRMPRFGGIDNLRPTLSALDSSQPAGV